MPNPLDLIYRNINRNRAQLKGLLDQLVASVQNDHEEATAKLLYDLSKAQNAVDADKRILNLSIVYTDNFRKLARKVDNLILDKNIFFGRNDQIVAYHNAQLSEAEQVKFRQTFAKICDYSLKGSDEMKLYQDPKFCSYIITKTFKKTFNEMVDFLSVALDKQVRERLQSPIKIVAIGGGPGNDGLAVATFLRTRLIPDTKIPIQVTVMDLNAEAWRLAAAESVNKLYSNLGIVIDWVTLDHTKPFELGDLNANFISACWTLNEHNGFNELFWTTLAQKNPKAIFLVIEGEARNVDSLYDVLGKQGFEERYYEKYANPRRLIAFKP